MSNESFFKFRLTPQEWKEGKKEIEAYNAREIEHAHALDNELTGERLLELTRREQQQKKCSELANKIVELSKKMQQEITATPTAPRERILEDISDLKNAIADLEAETLKDRPRRNSSNSSIQVK